MIAHHVFTCDEKGGLGRIRAIVASITPETLPGLNPVHLNTLRGFVAEWRAKPASMRQGTWDERERMLCGSLELEARVIETAILGVKEAEQAIEPKRTAEPDEYFTLRKSRAAQCLKQRRTVRQMMTAIDNREIRGERVKANVQLVKIHQDELDQTKLKREDL